MLSRDQVSKVTGLYKDTISRKVREGDFPKPDKYRKTVSKKAPFWSESTIKKWLEVKGNKKRIKTNLVDPEFIPPKHYDLVFRNLKINL